MSKKLRRPARRRLIPQPVETEVLNAEGAARLLGVSTRLVLHHARQKKLPGKKIGKEWRFRRSALLEWLGKVEPAPPEWLQGLAASGKVELLPPKKR